jgi:hypothetical protein
MLLAHRSGGQQSARFRNARRCGAKTVDSPSQELLKLDLAATADANVTAIENMWARGIKVDTQYEDCPDEHSKPQSSDVPALSTWQVSASGHGRP